MQKRLPERVLLAMVCGSCLLAIFLLQRIDVARMLHLADGHTARFLINRTIRFLLNDACAIGLIYALFPFRKYVLFSVFVQALGMVFILFPYFALKIYYPHYNGPMINFLHRLVLNPVFLLLLIPAFYYQRIVQKKTEHET
jgi:exosortase F-associated protein